MSAIADALIEEAAECIREAEALIITAGAGMGVDSGLPDFRGPEGFWQAYPPFRQLGLKFQELANPKWFKTDPRLAWGFYGHRLQLYRQTQPHVGFSWLLEWMNRCRCQGFIFTSNVDGHFQRAGFPEERVVECHGSIHRLQRIDSSELPIWDAAGTQVEVDGQTMRAVGDLPSEPETGVLARPNILMFNDALWNDAVMQKQFAGFTEWLLTIQGRRIVIMEIGAGLGVPTVRHQSEVLADVFQGRLIRINPREANVPTGHLSLVGGGMEALRRLRVALGEPLTG